MARAAKKKPAAEMIVFSRARDIPFNRIRLSDDNVRVTDVENGQDDLTHDIDRREDLIQGLNVRAVLDADGAETGDFEVPAGGRRYRSIQKLVKAGRFPADGLVPCIVKKADAKTSAVDDSLAENLLHVALHPLDQFNAFKRMIDAGLSREEVADAYRTTTRYIDQRLRLMLVAPSLLDAYAKNEMTLAMLEAFTVSPDKKRQVQVWKSLKRGYTDNPYHIRRALTEKTVHTSDRRARFVGLEAYEEADGDLWTDFFSDKNDAWLCDVGLLDRLVGEKLKAAADAVAAEGWKWIEAAVSFPYGYSNDFRRLRGAPADLSKREKTKFNALRAEYDELEAKYADAPEYPDEVDERLGELEDALAAFDDRPMTYAKEDMERAGAFVHIHADGSLIVERGYVRTDDEPDADEDAGERDDHANGAGAASRPSISVGGKLVETEEDDNSVKPLSDRLVAELTAHRTLALQDAVAQNPHAAMTMLLHKLYRDAYLNNGQPGCLEASVHHVSLSAQGPDLKDTHAAKAITERHDAWHAEGKDDDDALWIWLDQLDDASRAALLAHLVSFGVNALREKANPYGAISANAISRRIRQADRLARAVGLDMAEVGWRPTVDNFFGRVPKWRIIEAVREARGEQDAQLIDHLRKPDMAKEAERLLADTGWLPEPLRLPEVEDSPASAAALPAFLSVDDAAKENVSPAPATAAA